MAFRNRFRRLRSYGRNFISRYRSRSRSRSAGRNLRRKIRTKRGIRTKKIFGLSLPVFALILGVVSYLMVTPFKNFVNGLIGKKP